MPLSIGRWRIEYHQRAIHTTRLPDPHCPDCSGSGGGWAPHGGDVNWDECPCLDQIRTWRLPLWTRRPRVIEEPF